MESATLAGVVVRAELSTDLRSARVQEQLRRRWKEEIRRRPPAAREQWLDSAEGRFALGAKTCFELLRKIRRQRDEVAGTTAGPNLLDVWWSSGRAPEGLRLDDAGRLVPHGWAFDRHGALQPSSGEAARPTCPRLVRSRFGVRSGEEHPPGTPPGQMPIAGPPVRRWTPPTAVDEEDKFDGMDWLEAADYTSKHPSSGSAAVIILIGEWRAKPADGQW